MPLLLSPLTVLLLLLRLGVGLLIVLISVVRGAVTTLVLGLLLTGLALRSELLLPPIAALPATSCGLLEPTLVATVVEVSFIASLAVVVVVSSFHRLSMKWA